MDTITYLETLVSTLLQNGVDEYVWESAFAVGNVPSFTVFDAQVNYRIPSLKTTLKLGGTNIGGSEYFTAVGTAPIGSLYYLGLTINNF